MKRFAWMVSAAAAVAIMAAPVLAADAAKPAKGNGKAHEAKAAGAHEKGGREAKGAGNNELAEMEAQLSLTPEQKTQLAEKFKAKAAALESFKTANAAKIAEIKQQQAAATDADAKKKVGEAQRALHEEQAKIEAEQDAAIMAVLTPDQQTEWKGYKLSKEVTGMLQKRGVTLTADQQKQVRALAVDATKAPAPAADGKKGHGAAGAPPMALMAKVKDQVLTADQKAALDAAAPGKGGDKAAAPKADKPAKADRPAKK